jgi:UDP-N-acetylglucosamine 4,6-dehydratase
MFKDKVILITGGTGSFGNAVLNRFLETDIKEIRIFSRDEKKQHDMRVIMNSSKLKFYIGDVRDANSLHQAMVGVDFVFHAAALKQVPSCEFFPMEAVKTNVIGTENVLDAAIFHRVKKVICLSTDKAVYPINAMGISKSMMEKVAVAKSRLSTETIITVTRYGNVMASRGSVIPHFTEQILAGKDLTVTNPHMTRFMMTLDEAVELVLFAFQNGKSGDIFVQKSPASTINELAEVMIEILNANVGIKIIGTRHGEKLYESLLSKEEFSKAVDLGDYFKVSPDGRDLNYEKYFDLGIPIQEGEMEYNSHNTSQLSKTELFQIIEKLPFMQSIKGKV